MEARSPETPVSAGSLPEFSLHAVEGRSLPIQPKLTIGAPNDKYEQEADQVAKQVVQRLSLSDRGASTPGQAQPLQLNRTLQRDTLPDEEDELQMKPLAEQIQRVELPEEDELQMKPNEIQRETDLEGEEELQMKPMLQMKRGGAVAASDDLESAIQQSRGGGQPLADSIRKPMEQAFGGVNFRGVKVHTNAQSDRLNRSIQAKAFTTGQDIFFRQGAYQPTSQGGQELLAHELTHVVQQVGQTPQQGKRDKAGNQVTGLESENRIQRLSSREKIENRAEYRGGKKKKSTWYKLMECVEEYNKKDTMNPDQEAKEDLKRRLIEIQDLIKHWISGHSKMPVAIKELSDLYHEVSTELYVLKNDGVTGLGGGYAGKVDLVHPQRRGKEEGKTKLGSQGYKLHVSYKNTPENVDKVMKALSMLSSHSLKIIQNPRTLVETQQNKYAALYPKLTPVVTPNVKLNREAKTTEEVTWYEANKETAMELAELVEVAMDVCGVEPGGPVPNEEQVNQWTYTRYGSFTGKEIHTVKNGVLVNEFDKK
ncbi:DUF4157 domain-containing protein [Leptolyngbya sp. AN02str]|uniref:eCIS core domain-containing protein n=1 Tax=Leptolyngbya sp. AN02str TaxID=3423363 RepID=UPI003D313B46